MPAKTKPRAKSASRAAKPRKAMPTAKPPSAAGGSSAVDQHIRGLGGWRGRVLAQVRSLIVEADPDVVEDVKWRKPSNGMAGVPVWSHDGLLCTGEPYKDKVKVTFAYGAALRDPAGLFNANDRGGTRRAIDIRDGDSIDSEAFRLLVRAAVARNIGAV